jgi:hypothetical protein
MRLYKTTSTYEAGAVTITKWSGTQADAKADVRAEKDNGAQSAEWKEVDVPTDKAGLLAWLNANVSGE